MKILLIDDERNIPATVIARTGQAGIELLQTIRNWDELLLDNDLGLGSPEGWEILRLAIDEGLLPPKVELVTSNPVALERMHYDLIAAGYSSNSNKRIYKLLPCTHDLNG